MPKARSINRDSLPRLRIITHMWIFIIIVLVTGVTIVALTPSYIMKEPIVIPKMSIQTHRSTTVVIPKMRIQTHESKSTTKTSRQIHKEVDCSFKNQTMLQACDSYDRAHVLQAKCKLINGSIFTTSAKQFKLTMGNIFVDAKHHILACLPPKAGCTTWKTILANNSQSNVSLPQNIMRLHFDGRMNNYGIFGLDQFSERLQKYFLTSGSYLKFMIARHPFERLYSAYIDKIIPMANKKVMDKHVNNILNLFHAHFHEGQVPTFHEFVQYLKTPMSNDWHWKTIYDICQPCLIHYDHVFKTETLDQDSYQIIKSRLKPYHRGVKTRGNIVVGGCPMESLLIQGKKMEGYNDIDDHDFQYLVDRYKADLDMFGYSFKRDNTSLHTFCSADYRKKRCC